MSEQIPLFEITAPGDPPPKSPGRCTPPGNGPAGETCRTCAHYTRVHYHGAVYLKCGLMRPHWTHGAGSDIRAKWPACGSWQPANDDDKQK